MLSNQTSRSICKFIRILYLFSSLLKDFEVEDTPKSGRKRAPAKGRKTPKKADAESDGEGEEPKTPKSAKKSVKPRKQSVGSAKKSKLLPYPKGQNT